MNKKYIINIIILLTTTLTWTEAKVGRQTILQSSDNPPIIALGDIPNPLQYQPIIEQYMNIVTERIQNVENILSQLSEALEKEDLRLAQKHYIEAHYQYESVRPIILLFGNIDRVINSKANAFANKEQDPNFSGFHAVEYELFITKNIQNARVKNQKLLKNIKDLVKRVEIETIFLPKLIQATPDFAEHILENKLSGTDNIYSGADIGEIIANLDGISLIIEQLRPFLSNNYVKKILTLDNTVRAQLQKYSIDQHHYMHYSTLSIEDKHQLYGNVSELAEQLSQLRSLLDIQVYHSFPVQNALNEES